MRARLEAAGVRRRWKGGGPNKRFSRGRGGAEAQYLARERLRLSGALEPVRTIDDDPVPEPELHHVREPALDDVPTHPNRASGAP